MSMNFKDLKKRISIDRNKEIPEHVAELPYLRKKVCYRAMKNKELKAYLKAVEKRDEYLINKAFDDILDSCVVSIENDAFDNDEICTQDRTFLLVKVRQATLGDIVKFPHTNEVLEEPVEVEVNIDDFPVIYQDEPISEEVYLSDGIRAFVGPVKRGVEKELEQWLKTNATKDSMVDRRYCAYASLIEKIQMKNEETDEWDDVTLSFSEKVKFVEEYCGPNDLREFDKVSDKLDFGIKLQFSFKHDSYENEEEEISIISFFIT